MGRRAQGTYNLHGGTLTVNDIRTDSGTGIMYQDGGSATVNGWLRLGINSSARSSYTLAGGTLNINGANVPSGYALEANVGENGAGTLTIGGSGGGTMIVSPSGVLTVANGAGTGTLNLQLRGLLRTPNVAAGSGAATFNFSGGTLQNASSSGLTVAMPVNLSGQGTVAIDNGQTATFQSNAPIGGSGSLTKTGGGTMILQSNNTYTGGTTVEDGTLVLGNNQAIVPGSGLTVGDPSVFPAITAGAKRGCVCRRGRDRARTGNHGPLDGGAGYGIGRVADEERNLGCRARVSSTEY